MEGRNSMLRVLCFEQRMELLHAGELVGIGIAIGGWLILDSFLEKLVNAGRIQNKVAPVAVRYKADLWGDAFCL